MGERDFEDRVFEERVALALRHYADEVPTAVDASRLARDVASDRARTAPGTFGIWSRPALRLAWLVLLLALLAVAFVSLAVVGHRPTVGVDPIVVTGSAICTESEPGTASPAGDLVRVDGIVTVCAVALSDARASGQERRTESRYAQQDGSASGTGTCELQGPGGRWTGKIATQVSANGVRIVEGTYDGSGESSGLRLVLRAVSGDGRRWSLTGSIARRP